MAAQSDTRTRKSARARDFYLPGLAYDEMFAADGAPRPHYRALFSRIASLSAAELDERQHALEQSFLLQGITFTVYGAGETTERIIPTDLFPRILPAREWTRIEQGLSQRLRALNAFLADIYGAQKILADGVTPRDLVLGAPSYRREMHGVAAPHASFVNVSGADLIRAESGEFYVLEDNLRCLPASATCWPTATPPSAPSPARSETPAFGRWSAIRTFCWRC